MERETCKTCRYFMDDDKGHCCYTPGYIAGSQARGGDTPGCKHHSAYESSVVTGILDKLLPLLMVAVSKKASDEAFEMPDFGDGFKAI